MLVPAGSPIFFLRKHRFAVQCRVVTLRQLFMDTIYAVILVAYVFIVHILIYRFFVNIGWATLYHLSMMYVTVYNLTFNSNCQILPAELNYRFTIIYNNKLNFTLYLVHLLTNNMFH